MGRRSGTQPLVCASLRPLGNLRLRSWQVLPHHSEHHHSHLGVAVAGETGPPGGESWGQEEWCWRLAGQWLQGAPAGQGGSCCPPGKLLRVCPCVLFDCREGKAGFPFAVNLTLALQGVEVWVLFPVLGVWNWPPLPFYQD